MAAVELQHLGDQVPAVPARPDRGLAAPDLVVPLVPGDLGWRVGVARHAVELQPLAHRAVGDLGRGALAVPPDVAQVQSRPARLEINLKTDKSITISVLCGVQAIGWHHIREAAKTEVPIQHSDLESARRGSSFTEKLVFWETEGKWSPLEASQLYWTWLSARDTTRNSLATLWSFSLRVKFWFSMYSPCLVRRDNIDRETYNRRGWYLNHLSVGRGLPCLDMHVRTRLSPSLRDIEGNPDIVGASGGPGNKKVSKLQIEKFSPKHLHHTSLYPF